MVAVDGLGAYVKSWCGSFGSLLVAIEDVSSTASFVDSTVVIILGLLAGELPWTGVEVFENLPLSFVVGSGRFVMLFLGGDGVTTTFVFDDELGVTVMGTFFSC